MKKKMLITRLAENDAEWIEKHLGPNALFISGMFFVLLGITDLVLTLYVMFKFFSW